MKPSTFRAEPIDKLRTDPVEAPLHAAEPGARYLAGLQPPLLKSFDLLATAPGGVAKLRELILSLAVQGKLVAQDPNDEPASVLLERVAAEKARLVKEGKIKKEKPLAEIAGDEKPFELPVGWRWVRLGDIAYSQAGFAFKATLFNDVASGLPLIRIRDVGANDPSTYFSGDFRPEFLVEKNDWLISMDGDFRVARWAGPQALLNQRVSRLIFFVPDLAQVLICMGLQIELTKLQGQKAYTTVDHLSGGQISTRVIALPPLAEQSRIVARVEELMQLCDALEAQGRLEAEQHARLVATLLDTLSNSPSAEALAENWQRLATHFDLLLDRPAAVDALEQTILQLAVRGLLVPQDPSDEPASELLKKIRAEKDRLIAAGEIKRDKPLAPIAEDDKPFELPHGWRWAQLQELALTGPTNGLSPRSSELPTNFRCLTLSATTQGYFRSECFKYVDIEEDVARQHYLRNGDLLIQRGNSLEYVGIAALYDGGDDQFIYPDLMMRLRLSVMVNLQFVHAYLISSYGRRYFRANATGTQGTMPKVNQATVASTRIPVPPFAEQSRIVARVEELRRLCAELRARLSAAQATQSWLAQALVETV